MNTADGTRRRPAAGSGRQQPGQDASPGTAGAATWVEASRWSPDRVRALGMVTDLVTAAAILGLSRNTAYALAREGAFPVPVLRVGRLYRVSVPALLDMLGVTNDPAGAGGLDNGGSQSVDHTDAKPAAHHHTSGRTTDG